MPDKFSKYVIVIIASGAIAIIALNGTGLVNTCHVKQIGIVNDLKKYAQTKDPEFCAQLNDKISRFDNECKGDIEILDCG